MITVVSTVDQQTREYYRRTSERILRECASQEEAYDLYPWDGDGDTPTARKIWLECFHERFGIKRHSLGHRALCSRVPVDDFIAMIRRLNRRDESCG